MNDYWEIVFKYGNESPERKKDSHFLLDILMEEGLPYTGKLAGENQEPEIFVKVPGDPASHGFNRPTLEKLEMVKKFKEYCQKIRSIRE